ncbi:substrate-binding domain-containing protein [Trebonia sp.]|uniref:substrate-binding domain-containing protein n=1 Tax=Trebonia sp. TaxID=2767075 RepID=UPI0026204A50|nr:substrate-binding domain-containing protein [Trebonia sp.]
MRKLTKLFAGAGAMLAAAALVASTATTAMADPPKGVVPRPIDIVGVGSDTTAFLLDQISHDYDAKVSAAAAHLYSWDATPPGSTSSAATKIKPKAGCPVTTRPDGSSAGVKALDANELDGTTGHYCIDYSRSSGGRSSTSPKLGPGGVAYVAFAKDAVTWATRSTKHGGSDAPKSLSLTQLEGIFKCTTTNWDQVGGKDAKITVFLPQAGSGTLSFWEKVMGITTLGSCVSQKPEENEGTYAGFNSPNAIFIYSVGDYVAQVYHSPVCGKAPKAGQNLFGCNVTGYLQLDEINGVSPVTSAKVPVINYSKFPSEFIRTLYNVVRYSTTTADHIPAYLESIFSAATAKVKGYLCTSAVAKADIVDYGFINTSLCGTIS